MDFRKIPHPVNFRFVRALTGKGSKRRSPETGLGLEVRDLGEDVFHLRMSGRAWADERLLPLSFKGAGPSRLRWSWRAGGGFSLGDAQGAVLGDAKGAVLSGGPGAAFGVCGKAWMLRFEREAGMRFYGLGEKSLPFERSGQDTAFWNTDTWADFTRAQCESGDTDPMYVSIPFLLIKRPGRVVGVLLENPFPAFMGTGKRILIAPETTRQDEALYAGAMDGLPSVFFIAGKTPAEVVEKLQRLSGTTPLPPLWALGHHQCRWGYQSFEDLDALDRSFRRHKIPCDGLWLDIGYMERFKVFTFGRKNFKNPAAQLAELRRRGRRVVPILDPGVKAEPGTAAYDDGLRKKIFCLNPEARPFRAFVWPGRTVFPDFSLKRGRAWWAKRVEAFARLGVSGAWLDMNEPALSTLTQEDMLFQDGSKPHAAYHNQYALGMAMASREGFLRARPNERPFLVCRAGCAGSNRFAACWTGDNYSNWTHLKKSMAISLNLALSGAPFNGPDVPGFAGHADAELARAWYKAGFLFPFFRNHSVLDSRRQEPWAFGPATLKILRRYIRLRYKLLPYLYNLFIGHSERGTAILRPLFYEFPDAPGQDFDFVDDQFMVGPALMQAPVVEPGAKGRRVALPPGHWFDAGSGRRLKGGRAVIARPGAAGTPLYFRDGSVVAMQAGPPGDGQPDLRDLELHVFLGAGSADVDYGFDDGESFDFQKGARTRLRFHFELNQGRLDGSVRTLEGGYGAARVRVVVYGRPRSFRFSQDGETRDLPFAPHRWTASGSPLRVWISPPILCGPQA